MVFEGSDAALAEHDLGVAGLEDVLGGEEELVDGRRRPALEKHGPARFADFFQQWIVLHVAGADLQDVRVGCNHLDLLRAMTSVTTASPVACRASARSC